MLSSSLQSEPIIQNMTPEYISEGRDTESIMGNNFYYVHNYLRWHVKLSMTILRDCPKKSLSVL